MTDHPTFILVLGGARSGKSLYAEQLISAYPAPWFYIATAEAHDEEMRDRIALHRGRRDANWKTVEAPLHLADAIGRIPSAAPVLIDCLTLWLTNHLLAGSDLDEIGAALEATLVSRSGPTVAVANEVGLGIVPEHALGRRFRDAAGRLNQRLAARAEKVFFMVAGLPIKAK